MGLLERLNKKKATLEEQTTARMEEYSSLIRVYMQAVFAAHLGITNLAMLPELRDFKGKLKIPTQVKLGLSEKKYIKNYMIEKYEMKDFFFDNLDSCIKRSCKKLNDVQPFSYSFQAMSQNLFLAVTKKLGYKLQFTPTFLKNRLKSMTKKAIDDIFNKTNWSSAEERAACENLLINKEKLRLNEAWMFEYVFPIIMIAKGAKTESSKKE